MIRVTGEINEVIEEHGGWPIRYMPFMGEPWRYRFYFLSPEKYPDFFDQVRGRSFAGWKLGLMRSLMAELG